jgi:hypothetical protein
MQEYWQEKAIAAIEYLCKKVVDAFMGNYPVTYNQPNICCQQMPMQKNGWCFHGKLSCYIQPTW